MTAGVICPYCGANNRIWLDLSGGTLQQYVEDCQICCQPWQVTVDLREPESPAVDLRTLDD